MLINLPQRIALWQKNGVIDSATAERLLAFEQTQTAKPWVVFGIAGIGITALLCGVVSIVAANWYDISDSVKIVAYFALQLGVGGLFLANESRVGIKREVSLTVFALLFWAGIGLFSQMYNLKGETWQAMALWCALALPATLYSESRMLCSLWCATFLATGFIWWEDDWFLRNVERQERFARGCIVAALPLLLSTIAIFGHYRGFIRERLRTAAVTWGVGSILLVAVPMANSVWAGSYRHFELIDPFFLLIPWAAVVLAILMSLSRRSLSPLLRYSTAAMFFLAAVYITIPALWPAAYLFPAPFNEVIGAAGFIAVWALAATSAALASMKRLYDFASFMIALRFVIVYFEVFGSLSRTGVGLIISGAVIICIAIYWNKLRRAFIAFVQHEDHA